MQRSLSLLAELAGLALITVGFWMLVPWFALVVLGAGLMMVGTVIEPPSRGPE